MRKPSNQLKLFDEIKDSNVFNKHLDDADDDGPIKLYAHYSKEEIKVLRAHGFDPQN